MEGYLKEQPDEGLPMSELNKKDPVKYRKLVNQFRVEWVQKSEKTAIQILDNAQNFSIWLDNKGFVIRKVGVKNIK